MSIASTVREFIAPQKRLEGPARAALRAQLAGYRAALAERQKLNEMDAKTRVHRDAAAAAAGKVQAAQQALDTAVASNLYAEGAEKHDLSALRGALADAEDEARRYAPIARAAEAQHHRLSAQMAELASQTNALYQPVPRLAHAALIEDLETAASAFREAEETFRNAHRAIFIKVIAADLLAQRHQIGLFVGARRFDDLLISRPDLPAYRRDPLNNTEMHYEHAVSLQQLDVDAEYVLHELLTAK